MMAVPKSISLRLLSHNSLLRCRGRDCFIVARALTRDQAMKGRGARALAEGESHSASTMNAIVPRFAPEPVGWGSYYDDDDLYFFYIADFHNLGLTAGPDPAKFGARLAELHRKGTSPNGMFGYPITTVIGKLERTVKWERMWAQSFTNQLRDVITYDNETNGPWPKFEAACNQLTSVVIPRLLGALQIEGRNIVPSLIHGDLWENNVGIDRDSGDTVVFDPDCTYAHNEMEFGTWRCAWAYAFRLPAYMGHYRNHFPPSEPADEWDDRNRLYSLHPYLTDSTGHKASISRQM